MHTYMHTEINTRQNIAQCTNIIQLCVNTVASESTLPQVILFHQASHLRQYAGEEELTGRKLQFTSGKAVRRVIFLGAERSVV